MNLKETILSLVPKECPECGAPTELSEEYTHLTCTNDACGAKLARKIEILAKTLDVKNFGPAMCTLMVESGVFTCLEEVVLASEAFVLEDAGVTSGIASKMRAEMRAMLARGADDATVIAAAGPHRVAHSSANLLIAAFGDIEGVLAATINDFFTKLDRCGIPKATNLRASLAYSADTIRALRSRIPQPVETKEVPSEGQLSGMRVAVTGSVPGQTRTQVRTFIEDHGGKWATSVTGTTDILIIEDVGSTTSKAKSARKRGTRLVQFCELVEELGQPVSNSVAPPSSLNLGVEL